MVVRTFLFMGIAGLILVMLQRDALFSSLMFADVSLQVGIAFWR
jgi:hypothetical protein